MNWLYSWTFVASLLGASSAFAAPVCAALFNEEIRPIPQLSWYESLFIIDQKPTANIENFSPQQGIFVNRRDESGQPLEATIRVLVDNPDARVEVIGDFNNWGNSGKVLLQRDQDPVYYWGRIQGLKHGDQYRILVNDQQRLDPSSMAYSTPQLNQKTGRGSADYLNSTFWDIEGKGRYSPSYPIPDLRKRAMAIAEVELHSLAAHWQKNDQMGPPSLGETYNFIADSGIIEGLKKRGINAVEFLPFNAAADGDRWALRYQVYGMFAIESKFGTPAEFARMVDKFNKAGIAVIMDVLLSHYPYDANTGNRQLRNIGLHTWVKADGQRLYGQEPTEWGTFRYDYENPYVRRFLIDSVLNAVKYFHIGGIRIDNYDGIRFRPGGTEFLKQLAQELRAYAPQLWLNAEMFFPENAVTKRRDQGGHGMNTYNNGNFFWNVVRSMAQLRTEEIDMNVIRGVLRNDWNWNEVMRLNYPTNHDEAANRTSGATGAYFASLVNGGGWDYVEGKTRAFGALTMLAGSYYMDMPQFRILQEGTFSQNPIIEWDNLRFESQRRSDEFFAKLSNYFISQRAFAPHNMHPNIENHIDYNNKVISFERIDFTTGKRVYAIVNLSHNSFENYQVGVGVTGNYRVMVNNETGGPEAIASSPNGQHSKPFSITLPRLGPYGVVVIEN